MWKRSMAGLVISALLVTFGACHKKSDESPIVSNPTTTDNQNPNPNNPNPTAPQVANGIFVDAAVEGLSFVSGAQTGTTDAAGTFRYEVGQTVQFKVGNISLGKAPGKPVMTPADLVLAVDSAATPTDPRIVQITQFLMTVNSNPPTALTMSIPAVVSANAAGFAAVDLSTAVTDLAPIIAVLAPAKTVVPAADAIAHIQATAAARTAPKAGAFAAIDSIANPTLGIVASVVPNAIGNAFNVTGKAVSMQGATWNVAGTMTIDGILQATGTGTGAVPPGAMTITGVMISATQIDASARFTLNAVDKQVPLTFEKAVAPATIGTFVLAVDPGVTNAAQVQHVAAHVTLEIDGQITANLLATEITGLPLVPLLGARSAGLLGVVTSTGSLIGLGGLPGAGETVLARSTGPSPVVLMTGTAGATLSAKIVGRDLTGAGVTIPPLTLVPQTNPLSGVYAGAHTDTAPGLPSTFNIGVTEDGGVHGYTKFLRQRPAAILETDFLLDGTVDVAGILGFPPAPFNPGPLGAVAAFPGLVMTDDENTITLTPGTFAGNINANTGTVSGNWQTGPAPLATGSFNGTLLP